MTNREINYLCNFEAQDIEKEANYPENFRNPLNKILAMDCKNLLPEKYLMKTDKATMANSVEERIPFLDKNIVNFAFSLPNDLKIRGNTNKFILRKCAKNMLPDEILSRKKQGFGTPIDYWMDGELREIVEQNIYESEIIKNYFNKSHLEEIVQNARPHVTWTVFALGLWFDIFF
jgi:asparagine synthase (glutamine-hydrolysing)